MGNSDQIRQSSNWFALIILIPSLLLGILAIVLGVVGLGLIPLIPSVLAIVLGIISILIFKNSYMVFTRTVIIIAVIAALISVFRGAVLGTKVANDNVFDSTIVNTKQGIDSDLNDAFGGKDSVSSH